MTRQFTWTFYLILRLVVLVTFRSWLEMTVLDQLSFLNVAHIIKCHCLRSIDHFYKFWWIVIQATVGRRKDKVFAKINRETTIRLVTMWKFHNLPRGNFFLFVHPKVTNNPFTQTVWNSWAWRFRSWAHYSCMIHATASLASLVFDDLIW